VPIPARAALPIAFALALAAGAASPARAADPVAVGGVSDLAGPRTLALGAGVGILSGNEGLFVNPGAIGARKRYSADTYFTLDRRSSGTVGRYLGGSVVDAISSAPAAVSFGYLRSLDDDVAGTGNLFLLGLAMPLANRVNLGAQARWLDTKGGVERVNAVTADAGLSWEVSDIVTFGLAGYNLVPVGHEQVLPRGLGAGVAVGSDTSFKVTADWRADFDRTGKTTNRYGAGAELLLGSMVPVRAGFVKDDTLHTRWWSAGVGLVSRSGMALEAGYRQSLDDRSARTISLALKMFMLDM
jgi:hypothetical protein